MRTTAEFAAALRTNFDGTAWYGTPLRKIVAAVAPERAFAAPAGGVRNIAELLAHVIAWMEIVDERLRGIDEEVTPERDFPSVDGVTWGALLARLDRAHAALLATVQGRRDEEWGATVGAHPYDDRFMVDGLLHHNTYHGAQIALLNRMLV